MKRALLTALQDARAGKQPAVLVTELVSGAQALVVAGNVQGSLSLDDALLRAVDRALRRERGENVEIEGRRYFVHPFLPPRRMIIVGAVHIAQALVQMAKLSGYAVTVVDPRAAFATEDRFPGITLCREWPDEAMAMLDPDRRTAVVTLTHDPKLDDPALVAALRSKAFYIGALGSRRTHGKRLERLRALGFSDTDLGRIHAPIGLDIGAVSPAEIAVSILAEVTQVLHARAEEMTADRPEKDA